MPFFKNGYDSKESKDSQNWEIVSADWWRTPLTAVSWSFGGPEDPACRRKDQTPFFRGSLFHRPMVLPSNTPKGRSPSRDVRGDVDTSLNLDLAGVQGALEALTAYENDVGFQFEAYPTIEKRELETFLCPDLSNKGLDEEEILVHKDRWNELLEDLMRTPLAENLDSDESSDVEGADILHFSTSTLSSVDLSSSEGSIMSLGMPATPKAKSYNHVEIKGGSPTGSVISGLDYHSLSPGRSLNAFASSFVPGFSSHFTSIDEPVHFPSLQDNSTSPLNPTSSLFTNFTFPTLNPSNSTMAAIKPKKDAQGFYLEDSNPSSTLLPPFLQEPTQRPSRTRKSRTREMVDRLRSEASPNEENSSASLRASVSPNYASYSPSPLPMLEDQVSVIQPRRTVSEDGSGDHQRRAHSLISASASTSVSGLSTPDAVEEEDDGWIDVARPNTPPSTSQIYKKEDKSKRTRELFLALTKRRTDSISSDQWKEIVHNAGAKVENEDLPQDSSVSSATSPPKTPPNKSLEGLEWNPSSPPNPSVYARPWVEISPVGSTEADLPKLQKEKASKKESHHRKKSSVHNNHNHNHNQSYNHGNTNWARGPLTNGIPHISHHAHSHVSPHVGMHPVHPPVPVSTFQAANNMYPTPQPVMPHTGAPVPALATVTPQGPIPYFYPPYSQIGVRVPVVAPAGPYPPTPYGGMPHGYHGGVYAASPPGTVNGGFAHLRQGKLVPPVNMNMNMNAALPMPVPMTGYSGMGMGRAKGGW